MGLDLYAGTLVRYHTGEWETEAQRTGREAGVQVQIAYPEGAPKKLSKFTAAPRIWWWRQRVQRKYRQIIRQQLNWPAADSTPYFARKPDHDGLAALILAAAHAEFSEFELPTGLPASLESAPAYRAASEHYLQSQISVLECQMFLPSPDNFILSELDACGVRRFITSTGNLAAALQSFNEAHWRADESQIAEWATRSGLSRYVFVVERGEIVREENVDAQANPFAYAAQFAFALYSEAVMFSRKYSVPIVTDE
jgi:hypothetical protein